MTQTTTPSNGTQGEGGGGNFFAPPSLSEARRMACEIPVSPYLEVHPLFLRALEQKMRGGLIGIGPRVLARAAKPRGRRETARESQKRT